jgi:rhodanese-related sulfurtransferase
MRDGMTDSPVTPPVDSRFPVRPSPARVLLGEIALVVIAGLVLAVLANALSPRGLSLGRDYFPRAAQAGVSTNATAPAEHAPGPTGQVPAVQAGTGSGVQESVAQRLAAKGLRAIEGDEAFTHFQDPLYQQESIVFIDARDDRHYAEGHIPGAFQFDRYYPEKHLPNVLPACLSAVKVIVYCTGGHCEDSEFAALALKDAGVPADRILVYAGGITDWTSRHRPVELGGRKSGLRPEPRP